MRFIDLLKECQGGDSQRAFGRRIGCSQTSLSRIYSGRRRPGLKVLWGLVRAYPSLRERAIALFFASDYADWTADSPNSHETSLDRELRGADGED